LDLKDAVKNTVEKSLGWRPSGDICMLANFRYFGFNINPLATYYCFDESGENLQAIVAEVNNTPWNERRAYVLECKGTPRQVITFEKDFTVSPFNPLNMVYRWRSTIPAATLQLHIDTIQNEKRVTDATLGLNRESIGAKELNLILLRFPFMTLKVFLGIYWQALRLYMKGVPFLGRDKRAKSKAMLDFEAP